MIYRIFGISMCTFANTLFEKKSHKLRAQVNFFKISLVKKIVKIFIFLIVYGTFSSSKNENKISEDNINSSLPHNASQSQKHYSWGEVAETTK